MQSRGRRPGKRVGATLPTAPGSGAVGPRRFLTSSGGGGARGGRVPRGSAPHSCPGLYLTSGPRPAAAARAVHRIRQCRASTARPPRPAPFKPRGAAPLPPRRPSAPPSCAASTPAPQEPPRRDHPATRAHAHPDPRRPSREPGTLCQRPERAKSGARRRGEGPLWAHVPRGHGDVVEGEPDSGQQAQAPPLAHRLPLLARLRGAAVGAVLLAGRHGGRAAGGRGREGQGSGRGPGRARR